MHKKYNFIINQTMTLATLEPSCESRLFSIITLDRFVFTISITSSHWAGVAGGAHPTSGPTEEEYESGNGPSLPQSPASLPPTLDSDDDEKLLAK